MKMLISTLISTKVAVPIGLLNRFILIVLAKAMQILRVLFGVITLITLACCLAVLVLYPAQKTDAPKSLKTTTVFVCFSEGMQRPVDLDQIQRQARLNSPTIVATKAALQWWQAVFASAGQRLVVVYGQNKTGAEVEVGSTVYSGDAFRPSVRVCPKTLSVSFDHFLVSGLSTTRLSVVAAHALGHVFQLRHDSVPTSLMQADVDWLALPPPGSAAEALAVRGLHLKGVSGVCRCCRFNKSSTLGGNAVPRIF
jgi:hypothetical protein